MYCDKAVLQMCVRYKRMLKFETECAVVHSVFR